MSPTTIPGTFILQSPASNDPLLDLNTQPSLDLQFATGKTLNDRVSGLPLVNHQRDASSGKSAGTYVGSDGLIKTSVVNLLPYSEDFSQWATDGSTTVNHGQSAPNGSNTATLVTPNNGTFAFATNLVGVRKGATIAASIPYTYSAYVKSNGADYAVFRTNWAAIDGVVWFNFNTGQTGFNTHPAFTNKSITVQNVGNGWFRLNYTFTFSSAGNLVCALLSSTTEPTGVYGRVTTGDGTSGIYIWGAQLEEGSTASTYVPTTNLPSGAPRFDHDPVTGESLGLLIEEARTNLLTYSQAFNSTNYSTGYDGGDFIENATAAPDGTLTASKLIRNTGASGCFWSKYNKQYIPVVSGTVYTLSCYLKAAEISTVIVTGDIRDGGGLPHSASFTLTGNGSYTLAAGTSAHIENVGNGWYRCSVTATADATVSEEPGLIVFGTGTSGQGFFAWGFQLEANASFPTSIIPTTSSAVTRAVDVVSIKGTNFSSWYNQSEGTVFAELVNIRSASANSVWSFDNNTSSQRIMYRVGNGFIMTGFSTISTSDNPLTAKHAYGFRANDYGGAKDGSILSAGTTGSVLPTVDRLNLGTGEGVGQSSGHISRLAYYPYRLSDTILQEITS